ncbi:hypothetical protein K431DRAFT_136461 [Polychaeton citri CBS 116435]|uniref:Uncharacterized protein n=1 Tax=Polychaeton citri CBS 116435 TaxID=1314669 RepID=A0A9P4Q4Q2_9PEZI|nr:hypothetical protein K431DRAFT_136461 [Polychaeton citri CBS 116435]
MRRSHERQREGEQVANWESRQSRKSENREENMFPSCTRALSLSCLVSGACCMITLYSARLITLSTIHDPGPPPALVGFYLTLLHTCSSLTTVLTHEPHPPRVSHSLVKQAPSRHAVYIILPHICSLVVNLRLPTSPSILPIGYYHCRRPILQASAVKGTTTPSPCALPGAALLCLSSSSI